MQEYLDRMKKCLILKWYSVRTQKSYVSAVKLYNEFLQKNSSLLGRDSVGKVESYLLFLHRENKAPKTINLSLFAIKFFYKEVLWKSLSKKIYTSKNVKKLPQILSKNEISKIVGVIKNEKHKLILMLAYGSWLRVSEVVKLKVLDIDFERKNIHIKNAKWKKDRVTLLPDKIDIDLKKMIYWKKNCDYIFESERGGNLTTRTCQKIFQNACKLAWIIKNVSFHSLRHSFATHLLENWLGMVYVQKLLWHSSIKTTQNYLHVANTDLKNIISPLDRF